MQQKKFTESQIVAAIKKHESGVPTPDICRELGMSKGTFYKWKARYGGMEVSEIKKVKELETELNQYKRMYAEISFELQAAKNLITKKF